MAAIDRDHDGKDRLNGPRSAGYQVTGSPYVYARRKHIYEPPFSSLFAHTLGPWPSARPFEAFALGLVAGVRGIEGPVAMLL